MARKTYKEYRVFDTFEEANEWIAMQNALHVPKPRPKPKGKI